MDKFYMTILKAASAVCAVSFLLMTLMVQLGVFYGLLEIVLMGIFLLSFACVFLYPFGVYQFVFEHWDVIPYLRLVVLPKIKRYCQNAPALVYGLYLMLKSKLKK